MVKNHLKMFLSGEISPNLVTLFMMKTYTKKFLFGKMSFLVLVPAERK